jgi:hypothetical protein
VEILKKLTDFLEEAGALLVKYLRENKEEEKSDFQHAI